MKPTSGKFMRPTRSSYRFRVQEPLQGSFGAIPVSIRDLSETGIQIEHTQALPRGFSGTLSYSIPGGKKEINLHAELRWSEVAGDRGNTFRSGVAVDQNTEALSSSLDLFIRKGIARLDRGKPEKTTHPVAGYAASDAASGFVIADGHLATPTLEQPDQEVTFDEIRVVEQARERLASSFEESLRWYNRGRYALAEESVQKAVAGIRHREDVLAVWEFLGRTLDIATIARAFDRRSY